MISASKFAARVEQIADRDLTYKIGGVGKNGVCDCIGLIMGAMYELGHKKYDLHSTNYFARYQTLEMKRVDQKRAYVGQILYKAREDTDDMNARYLPGGRYYTGDLLDYYHVGVVTRINPLRVIECTEYSEVSGIVVSASLKGWEYEGKLRDVSYAFEKDEPTEETEENVMALYQAKVITQEDPLTLRNAPDGDRIGKIPRGTIVDVLAEDGEWAYVRHDGVSGYAASKYLEKMETDYSELTVRTILTDSAGNTWEPVGAFTARVQLEVDGEPID